MEQCFPLVYIMKKPHDDHSPMNVFTYGKKCMGAKTWLLTFHPLKEDLLLTEAVISSC